MVATWKQRVVWSLPYVLVLVAAVGIELTEEIRFAIVALVGMWFLPSPINDFPNVSRETSTIGEAGNVNVSRETLTWTELESRKQDLPVPCHVLHGSADDHVLGCDGWRSPE